MAQLHFTRQGHGPLVVLSHALGSDSSLWDRVAALLEENYTVLRYDHRGHGRSAAPAGEFTIDDLADDAAELIQAQAGDAPVHFVGLSMGGMVGQALAARHPERVRSLVIANSASHFDAAARAQWLSRIDTVMTKGMSALTESATQRWFTPEFLASSQSGSGGGGGDGSTNNGDTVAALQAVLESTAPAPYTAACAAIAHIDLDTSNAGIACPTLVIASSRDEATPPALSEAIAQRIPGAKLSTLDTAHFSAVEQPEAFARLLTDFWQGLEAAENRF